MATDIKAIIAGLATSEAPDSASLRRSSIENAQALERAPERRPSGGAGETIQTFETVLLSSLVDDPEMSQADFEFMQEALTFAYSRDFLDERSTDHHRAKMIFQMACEQDWRSDEWTRHLRSFIQRFEWATFTPAEFFKGGRVGLHDYLWYCKRIEESPANAGLIGAYRVPGRAKPMYGWKADVGDRLPLFTPPDLKALGPGTGHAPREERPAGGIPADMREPWDATKRVLVAEGEILALVQQRNRAYSDTEMYRKRAEAAEEQARALQKRVRVLTDRLARHEKRPAGEAQHATDGAR